MSEKIQVLIVDDHPLTRVGLQVIIRKADNMVVVGEAASSEDALLQAERVRPDVILVDVGLHALFISLDTAKSHVRRILEKLLVRDRTQAAIVALKLGLVKAEK